MKLIRGLSIVLIIAVMAGCAKRIEGPGLTDEESKSAKKFIRKKQKVVLISNIHHSYAEQLSDTFNRKVLHEWWDMLVSIKEGHIKTPMIINISGPVIKRLTLLEEELQLDSLLTLDPRELTSQQVDYLKEKHNITGTLDSLLSGQIMESLTYLGNVLKDDPVVQEIIEKSDYTISDKNRLLDFIKGKILDFDMLLQSVLDLNRIEESITSLSDAHMGLLDRERIKVQILESVVNYKMWREDFPAGFILKRGYLNEDALEQFSKTSIRWMLANSENMEDYVKTIPQVLYADDYFHTSYSSTTLFNYIAENFKKKREPHVMVVDFGDIGLIVEDKFLKFIDYEEFSDTVFDRIPEENTVDLDTSTFKSVPFELTEELTKIKGFLENGRDVIYKYRNSGRASYDVLMDVQNKLLIAEAGDTCDNLGDIRYDRIFRKSVIDIYRGIGISPPIDLFKLIIEKDNYVPDEEMTSVVEVTCDGRIEPGEWEGALKVDINNDSLDCMYCGFDEDNLYYMLKLATCTVADTGKNNVDAVPKSNAGDISSAGVYIGHANVSRAAVVPRGHEDAIKNIQDYPIYVDVNWRKNVSDKTVIYRTTGNDSWEALTGNYDVGYSTYVLEFAVPFKYLDVRPRKQIYFKVYSDKDVFPLEKYFVLTVPDFKLSRGMLSYIDPVGDTYGPGNYRHSVMIEDYKDSLDLRKIEVDENADERVITLEFSALDNPYSAPHGFSLPIVDIYIDINQRSGLGRTELLEGRKAYTFTENAWEYCISVNGWSKAIYNAAGKKIGEPDISASLVDKTLNIFIPKDLIAASVENWRIIPLVVLGDKDGNLIEVKENLGDNEEEFRGKKNKSDTNIIDVILPPGYQQRSILGANRKGRAIELPALKKQ